MKILMIDKYHFVKGGAERYMFELTKILRANGHKVVPFAMKHPDNRESEYSEYFTPNIEFNQKSIWDKVGTFLRASGKMIYSFEAKRRLESLIVKEEPDIAHLHMIEHQLSPSILHILKKYNIPMLQTVHQYKLVCPNYRLFNPGTGQVCEKCLHGNFWNPIREKCHKNSLIASAMVALESSLHRWLKIYVDNIDLFHVPSHFMGIKFQQAGIGEGKIRHLFYTINMQDYKPGNTSGEYFLFLGRLSDEKGVVTLLKAAKNFPDAPFYIVGDGPQRVQLESFAQENLLPNVKFLGSKEGEELEALVRDCRAVVVPSEWYDNSPLVIYEAFAYSRPVICAKMGGMPELVDHEENGLHFEAGNVESLSTQLKRMWREPEMAVAFGQAARAKAEKEFDPNVHYCKIYKWYQELMERERFR